MAHVLFFGGSDIQGIGDPEGGWVDRFKRELCVHMYGPERMPQVHGLFNLGILGNTATQVLERIPYELPERQWAGQNMVIVLSVGANDSKAVDAPANYLSNSREFMATVQNIIDYAHSFTPYVVLIGLTPIDETHTRPTSNGSYFTLARIQEFNSALQGVSESNNVPLIDLYTPMQALDWKSMLYEDGLHLNGLGHDWVYQRIRQPIWTAMQAADRPL